MNTIIFLIGTAVVIFCIGMLYNAITNLMVSKEDNTRWRKVVADDE